MRVGSLNCRPGDRQAAKAAAAVALKRAEAAASRAVAQAGFQDSNALRRHSGHSVSDLPSSSLTVDGPTLSSITQVTRVKKFLRASSELRSVSGALQELHGHEEHLARLDRQLIEVERTRAMIAAACGPSPSASSSDSCKRRVPAKDHCIGRSLSSSSFISTQAAPLAIADAVSKPPELRASSKTVSTASSESLVVGAAQQATGPAAASWHTIELRPYVSPKELVDVDCACCLCPMRAEDLVLAFPCPARHVFHAGCLQKWLRSAGVQTTCPMCRAWPSGKSGFSSGKSRS